MAMCRNVIIRLLEEAQPISVPSDLRRAHRFIVATRDAASGLRPDESGRLDIGRRPGVMYLHVSREQLRRALLVAQAVVAESERRGWLIAPIDKSYNHRAGIAINIRGHLYAFEVTELTNRVPMEGKRSRGGGVLSNGGSEAIQTSNHRASRFQPGG
jgi:hypothetical protein